MTLPVEVVIYIGNKDSGNSPFLETRSSTRPEGLLMPRTCLIAAHDPWLLQLLRVYIEESGLRAVQVHEGQDVLPMIEKEEPAAILLQVDLPGQINGWELLDILNQNPRVKPIPILAFSWQNEGVGELVNSAAAYLQEPVTYEAFVDALRKAGICG